MESVTFCWAWIFSSPSYIPNGAKGAEEKVGDIQPLGPPEPAAVLELNEEFREAYSKAIVQVWYPSIDIHFILLHVEFEDGLSILTWRDRGQLVMKIGS
ncbi:hypothetical protein [Absidia glauca]|uniref:Uncharacterized protein n=1 Tax=Absidia glauca TaxID=4829 RepID=A0A168MYE6_ABSGL|nr:hypothetical protein [Absidia glauca]